MLQASGQREASEAQARSAEAQASAFRANAVIAQQNAAAALQAGEVAKSRQERIGKARLASKATRFLKAGVVLTGSPLAVLGEEALNEALQAADVSLEAQIKQNQFQNQAKLQTFFSDQATSKAGLIRDQADTRVGTSLLGSALKIFN